MTAPWTAGDGKVVALCGGIGGAKLALGLSRVVPAELLTIIVNTGDDFDHFGLRICPDIDTVLYTLAGRADGERGWGRSGETWRFIDAVGELGGETWFNLGDTDLATHAVRTARLGTGERLTDIVRDFSGALGVGPRILPVTDDRVTTMVHTDEGVLAMQHYFVRRRCEPAVTAVAYPGADLASVTPEVAEALEDPALASIVLCPSNPYLSIDPMLAVSGFRSRLEHSTIPRIAVMPLIGGQAVKGPLAKMMREMDITPDCRAIAQHYGSLVDVLIIDQRDEDAVVCGPQVVVADTLMTTDARRVELAGEVLDVCRHMTK